MSTAAPSPADPLCTGNVPLPTPEQLPNDLDTLKRMIVELVATLHRERLDKDALRHRVNLLLQRLYGPRTERVNPEQLLLFAEWAVAQASDAAGDGSTAPPAEPDASAASAGPKRRCRPHGRGKLSADLPRRPLHHELCAAERLCVCGQVRVDIGSDMSEQVDWQPASLFVWQHWVHKYVCPTCAKKASAAAMTPAEEPSADTSESDTPVTTTAPATTSAAGVTVAPTPNAPATARGPAVIAAPRPPAPIAQGLPGAGLLAYLIVSKYFDHLPLHRLEHILKRQGLPLSRSTMCDWMAASSQVLRPLYDLMVSEVVQSAWLHTDDTLVKNQGHAPGTLVDLLERPQPSLQRFRLHH